MAHFSVIFAMAGSSDMTRFGSLEFPALRLVGMWVPPVFEPSQAFLFGSMDFTADWHGILHLRVETLILAPIEGAPSISSGMHDNFNDEAHVLHSEQTLCSNPAVSNAHAVIYLLFSIFRRLPGGTSLSPPRPPYDRFPYGLASPMDAYARGLRRMPAPPPLTSKFTGMASYAPTCFLDIMDDDVGSDGSSIGNAAPSHRSSWE